MVANNMLVAASCLSAFIGSCLLVWFGLGRAHTRTRFLRVQQRVGNKAGMHVLQTGVSGLSRVSRFLLKYKSVKDYCVRICLALEQRNIFTQASSVLSVLLAACMLLCVLAALLGRVVLGPIASVGLVLFVGSRVSRAQEQRIQRMRDALPEALQTMSSCFGAGFTLLQTFEHLEQELAGPLGKLFGIAASSLKTGASPQTALARIQHEGGVPELSFVSVALAVQHQTGGSMRRVLDASRDSIKAEIELRQSLRVHTAQAKLSARVVVGVTLGLVAAMMLLSGDFLQPFFSSTAGMCMLALAIVMQAAGIISVRRFLKVDVA